MGLGVDGLGRLNQESQVQRGSVTSSNRSMGLGFRVGVLGFAVQGFRLYGVKKALLTIRRHVMCRVFGAWDPGIRD